MKNKLLIISLIAIIGFSITACEGQIGPMGQAGPMGPEGSIGPEGQVGPMGPHGIQGEKDDSRINAVSIVWKGEMATAPTNPQVNWAYFNTTVGNAYIYDGTAWQLLAQYGAIGDNGVPIVWKGEAATAPANPELNWAYYNSVDKKSYIYNGTAWQVQIYILGIVVNTRPTKTWYIIGDSLDLTGLVVTATYSDDSTEQISVSAENVSGFESTTVGEKTVTVTYQGNTAVFTVNVIATVQIGGDLVIGDPVTIAAWQYSFFSSSSFVNATTGSGILRFISRNGNPLNLSYSSQFISVTSLNQGWWEVELSTEGYVNISVDFQMRSSTTGPRDFRLEYSVDGTTYNDIYEYSIGIASTILSYESQLPSAADNQSYLKIRWRVDSDIRVDGIVGIMGTNGINNIVITGNPIISP